jgi:hypothetical protein
MLTSYADASLRCRHPMHPLSLREGAGEAQGACTEVGKLLLCISTWRCSVTNMNPASMLNVHRQQPPPAYLRGSLRQAG